MSNEFKNDPENYSEMCKPHESAKAINESLQKFHNLVSEARKECKISDVLIVVNDSYIDENSQSHMVFNTGYLGSQQNAIVLAAYAVGKLREENEQFIEQLIKG